MTSTYALASSRGIGAAAVPGFIASPALAASLQAVLSRTWAHRAGVMVRKNLCWARDSTALPSWTERTHVMASSTVLPRKTARAARAVPVRPRPPFTVTIFHQLAAPAAAGRCG